MRPILLAAALIVCSACRESAPKSDSPKEDYLFVWAGDSAATASDFLAVINANPSSPKYGTVVSSIATGAVGTHPHHTEATMPTGGHLLANGFRAGTTWLFDLTTPQQPKILTTFGDVAGFSHPHTYVRLANGNVLATFQYKSDSMAAAPDHAHGAMKMPAATSARVEHTTGGLVEMDERGAVVRSASAGDTTIADRRIFPYSVLPMPSIDRAVSTTTDMDHGNVNATAEWVQFWRLSDLTLLKSIALEPGPRGDEHRLSGEPRLLPDGKSVYVHTFNCGLYLVRDVDHAQPTATFIKAFEGQGCGVPILTGRYWLQTVPDAHALVALDITDAEHPREVSRLKLGDDEQPHWIAIDSAGRRVVLNSGGGTPGNRLFIINFDPSTGALALDERFKDAGATRAGVTMAGKTWPHGFTGTAVPHGTLFSR